MIYLIVFFFSILFTNIACKSKIQVFHLIAIAGPIILLTFRDVSVGTDTHHYIDIFNTIQSSNSILSFIETSRLEIGFSFITYIIAHLGFSVNVAFFVYAILTVVPVYIGAMLMKEKASPTLVMALFYLMFYHYSFNIVRQAMSMSLIFLAAVLLLKNHLKIPLLLCIIAVLIHNTSIVFMVFFPILRFRGKKIIIVGMICALLMLVAFYFLKDYLLLMTEYYDNYLSEKGSSQKSYAVEMTINFFIVIYACLKRVKDSKIYLFASLITLVLLTLSPLAPFIFRLATFYDILLLIYIPHVIHACSKTGMVIGLSYLTFALFFWWFVFVFNNSGETMPYILTI